ncbi:MAG: hypothetical protein Q9169_004292 [Polycauliona sp. 2 TL-2023]
MASLSYMSPQQAQRIGNGGYTNIRFESHGSGKHQGEICRHRQLFDYEALLPGTDLFEEAKRQGGISPDELWLKINSRRRAAISTGNDDCRWVLLMARILGFAPHSPVCGPYGTLPSTSQGKEIKNLPIHDSAAPTTAKSDTEQEHIIFYSDAKTFKRSTAQMRELGFSKDCTRKTYCFVPSDNSDERGPDSHGNDLQNGFVKCRKMETQLAAKHPKLNVMKDSLFQFGRRFNPLMQDIKSIWKVSEAKIAADDGVCPPENPPSYDSCMVAEKGVTDKHTVKPGKNDAWTFYCYSDDVDSFIVPLPWDGPWVAGLQDERLCASIQGQLNHPTSRASSDAMQLDMTRQQYCFYLYVEHTAARSRGRRSRLDEIYEEYRKTLQNGKAVDSLQQSPGQRKLDESWGIEHPSLIPFKCKNAIKLYYQ